MSSVFLLYWPIELIGRLHPAMVHFPIALFIGALLMHIWCLIKKKEFIYQGMIYLGAITALCSALMGYILIQAGEYNGDLVDNHRIGGYVSSIIGLLTALVYAKRSKVHFYLPFVCLITTCLSVGLTAHWGASITHGRDYLSAVLPGKQQPSYSMAGYQAYTDQDSFPLDVLDRLNLDVRAIFAHRCYQCHSSEKQKGDLALDSKKGILTGGESGVVITPGSASQSELVRRIKLPRSDDEAMPDKGKALKNDEIALIELWINQGAHWSDRSFKVFREAPLTLTKPVVPERATELSNPIDKFVDLYFDSLGISWPTVVSDRKFVRRAYLDITGLLPTPIQLESFLSDPLPNKREQLIDALLNEKEAYALHWLSFWNDLLRNDYSGTGFITGGRKQISDWLYRALVEELPYDQMAKELINPSAQSEGFITGIQWRGAVNASQRTELQAAQNISQSLLGLNLKCASCHNSFVNNLTLDQAYGFANIFAEEPLEIYRCDKPTGRIASTSFLYPELGKIVSADKAERLRQLANVMVQPQNGRLYRTIVNRYWDRLLGRGLVAPVDEMDNLPWSQKLLDWLAVDFIEHGYDFHHLLKQIMTSRAYQLSANSYPSPEYLNSQAFVFRGPSVRRLTSEQFTDAFAQIVTPMYYGLAFDPDHYIQEADWIWHKEVKLDRTVLPEPGTRYFRKKFSAINIRDVSIMITADHEYQLYLNGQWLGKGDNWRFTDRYSIAASQLRDQNVIAIQAGNDGDIPNPAGLLFSMRLEYQDGSVEYLNSDRTWKTENQVSDGNWKNLNYDDSDWAEAWNARSSFWGRIIDFRFDHDSIDQSFVRASLVRQDEFMKSLGRPVRENVATTRNQEPSLLQSLMLSNSAFFHENIQRGAEAWKDRLPEDLIGYIYRYALGREPSMKEKKIFRHWMGKDMTIQHIEDLIWTVFLLPEFQFI